MVVFVTLALASTGGNSVPIPTPPRGHLSMSRFIVTAGWVERDDTGISWAKARDAAK